MAHLTTSIGELIGDLRRNKGWSQKEFAKDWALLNPG